MAERVADDEAGLGMMLASMMRWILGITDVQC